MSLLLAVTAAAQVSDSQLVKNAFPSYLDDGDGVRYSQFVRTDVNADGHPMIVAAYTNGARGAVRVLDDSGQVVAEAAPRGMSGFHGRVARPIWTPTVVPRSSRRFTRGTGAPSNASGDFDCPAGKITVRVVNGMGGQATDSGHVILNGKELLGPDDFKRQDHRYSVTAEAQEHNILTVRLDDKPGARIQVFVDQAQVAP